MLVYSIVSSVGSLGVPLSLTIAVPSFGLVLIAIAPVAAPSPPKSSLAVTSIAIVVPASRLAKSFVAAGKSSTGLTVTFIFALLVSPLLSVMV